jgi:translation elongation factor EF-Tu-like GTPase
MSEDHRWQFEVVEAFSITGRGTVVLGHMRGNMHNGEPAILDAAGTTRRLERVGIDILCRPKGDISPVGLTLPGVGKADVPPGAMIYSIDADD